MNDKKILDALRNILKQQNLNISISSSNMDTPFKELGIDSLSVASIIVGIEQELKVRIPDEMWNKITTIKQLVEEFNKLLSNNK